MSHTVIVEFKCDEGKGAGFLEILRGGLSDTRAQDGCELIEIYTDADDPDRIVLYEKWAKRENHAAYMEWRAANGMAEMIGPFMSGMPAITHLEAQPG